MGLSGEIEMHDRKSIVNNRLIGTTHNKLNPKMWFALYVLCISNPDMKEG